MDTKKLNPKVLKKLRQLLDEYPEEFLYTLYEETFFPPTLTTKDSYTRFEDDSPLGFLSVFFLPDGDAGIQVMSTPDPNDMHFAFRFRTDGGGGQSLRTRNALILLAEAIRRDNELNPQQRGPIPSKE